MPSNPWCIIAFRSVTHSKFILLIKFWCILCVVFCSCTPNLQWVSERNWVRESSRRNKCHRCWLQSTERHWCCRHVCAFVPEQNSSNAQAHQIVVQSFWACRQHTDRAWFAFLVELVVCPNYVFIGLFALHINMYLIFGEWINLSRVRNAFCIPLHSTITKKINKLNVHNFDASHT